MAYDFVELQFPPQLVTKHYFLMPTLIIPRKELVTSNNVNVCLQPSMEELHVLWKGVKAFDVYSRAKFNLHAMCIWSTHNFPTYKLFVGCVIKGHVVCSPCGLEIEP
jgi:hypothetical protein